MNWVDHEGSCYWFSRSGKPWLEAEKYCQLENAHLVVINSREEQVKPQPSQRQKETLGMQTLGGWVRLVFYFFLTRGRNQKQKSVPALRVHDGAAIDSKRWEITSRSQGKG